MMLRRCADGTKVGLARLAMLAAIAPGIGGDASAQVRQPELPLISAPWGGGMSPAAQAASAAKRPAFADANWNQEVCVIAYSFEGGAASVGVPSPSLAASADRARSDAAGSEFGFRSG